jgi:hypothetical protein
MRADNASGARNDATVCTWLASSAPLTLRGSSPRTARTVPNIMAKARGDSAPLTASATCWGAAFVLLANSPGAPAMLPMIS